MLLAVESGVLYTIFHLKTSSERSSRYTPLRPRSIERLALASYFFTQEGEADTSRKQYLSQIAHPLCHLMG